MRVRVKRKFKHEALSRLLPLGFETTLEKLDVKDATFWCAYRFKAADGNYYLETEISKFVGLKPLCEIFDKIEQP